MQDVVNFTANVSDEVGLDTCRFFMNGTSDGRFIILNKTVTGTNDQCSQNWTIDLIRRNVINFTVLVNDTSMFTAGGNLNRTQQIIEVADFVAIVSIGVNNSAPRINEVVNVSSNAITISVIRGNDVNFTIEINDSVGGIIYENSTKVTVANTPAGQATIVFPPDGFKTSQQPLSLNVTFIADPDTDVTNISYYINCILNQTSLGNTTFNSSDGVYILNVSLFDNISGAAPSANVTINFTVDTTRPIVNTTLNKSYTSIVFGDKINLTVNTTDNIELSFGQIIVNDTGIVRYFNFSLEAGGTRAQFSENITVSCFGRCVINFTARVNDTSNNSRTNDTIIEVADDIRPRINGSINNSAPRMQDVVNFTANVSDEVGLDTCRFFMNGTSDGRFIILNKTVTGTNDQCSQNWTIDLIRRNVINFTVLVNDTSMFTPGGNLNRTQQIIEVADFVAIVSIGVNNSAPRINEVVNVSSNATDMDNVSFCLIKTNQT